MNTKVPARFSFLTAIVVLFLIFGQSSPSSAADPAGIINTIAGNGSSGYGGDGALATSAQLALPFGVDVDTAGNVYIADSSNHVIRKVDSAGIITTVAGSITAAGSDSGDGGPATSAGLHSPNDVAVDVNGNLYIADTLHHRIRKVAPNGIISTIAGSGNTGDTGDGGPATAARLNYPHGIAVDSIGNLYIADLNNSRIRKVDSAGIITTIAGTGAGGFSGDGGPATQAQLEEPFHLAVTSNGRLYISQWKQNRIRRVTLWTACSNATGIPASECEALVNLFEQTNGTNWTNKTNWLQTTTPCFWFGVTCVNGHVTRLDLPNNHLSGSLPATVDAFTFIQYFDVSRNSIGGTIPAQLGNLPKLLYLHLAYNQFTGTIPATLGNLKTVVFFYLHNNLLTGSIPPELSGLVMVKAVTFTNNQLSGSIPASLGSLPQLQRLHMTNNSLSGTIPSELGNAVKLQELYLNANQFSGPLPLSLTNLTQMTGLWFQTTSLCEPADPVFQNWKATIANVQSTGVICSAP